LSGLVLLGILFGLAAALVWGAGDFAGGRAAGRDHPFQVLIVASLSGILLLVILAAAANEAPPSLFDAAWAAGAGVSGSLGITALYQGLAIGHAAQVAPLAAVITAVIPIAVGSWQEGVPSAVQTLGFGIALPAVWLVSRSSGSDQSASSTGLGLACLAGIGFGGFLVLIAHAESGAVFEPLIVSRTVSLIVGIVLVRALSIPPFKLNRPAVGCLAGCLDAGGNVFYLLATHYTRLDVAAVLSSMYPATTVALASWVLSQRLAKGQLVGVLMCLVATACMAA
jgi:drug/metabolite transporter (DMT)-like permease